MSEPNRLLSVVGEGTSCASEISLFERWPLRARRFANRSSASLSVSSLRRSAMISCALAKIFGEIMGASALLCRIHISGGFLIVAFFSLYDLRLKTIFPI